MKKSILFFFFLCAINIFGQQASTYFPSAPGFKWNYKVTPLDSLQKPIDSLAHFEIDTFANVQTYEGKQANIIISKSGLSSDIFTKSFKDTTWLSFSGTDSYRYFNSLSSLYSGGELDSLPASSFFSSLKGWYYFLKFAQTVNINYTILVKDTTITLDSISYPIRIEITGKRLSDETLKTEIGTFACKKFFLKIVLGIRVAPILTIPIITIPDSIWAAPSNWIVKSVIPATSIDLSYLGLNSVNINGSKTEIITEVPKTAGYNFSGVLTYHNSTSTPLSNTKIILLKNGIVKVDSVVTNSSGQYKFSNVENGYYSLSISPGYVWGGVNSTDALLIRKYLVNTYTFDSLQLKAADVNNTNTVNSTDALKIKLRVVGTDSTFASGDWIFNETSFMISNSDLVKDIKAICVGDVNSSYIPVYAKQRIIMK